MDTDTASRIITRFIKCVATRRNFLRRRTEVQRELTMVTESERRSSASAIQRQFRQHVHEMEERRRVECAARVVQAFGRHFLSFYYERSVFNCVEMEDFSCNWIKIKKDGEAMRYFARCWGPPELDAGRGVPRRRCAHCERRVRWVLRHRVRVRPDGHRQDVHARL
eukprot:PhM_4_TR1287/c0_g1_i1/m.65151